MQGYCQCGSAIEVESSEVKIKFATAFSPNPSGPGDGSFLPQSKRIDLFHPIYVEVPVEYRMRVFTRRGELVFETQEVFRGWDGYIHQEQAPGDVYVWMVEGKWADGEAFSFMAMSPWSGINTGNRTGILFLYCCETTQAHQRTTSSVQTS